MAITIDHSPASINLRGINIGDDFSQTLDISGDTSSNYTFTAAVRPKKGVTETPFQVAVGSYDSGDDTTPVTISWTDTNTTALSAGDYVWDMQWVDPSSLVLTIAAGWVTIISDVA